MPKNGSKSFECRHFSCGVIYWNYYVLLELFLPCYLLLRIFISSLKRKQHRNLNFSREVFSIALKSNSVNRFMEKPKLRQVFQRLKKLFEIDPWNYFVGYFTKTSSETLLCIIHLLWVQKKETRNRNTISMESLRWRFAWCNRFEYEFFFPTFLLKLKMCRFSLTPFSVHEIDYSSKCTQSKWD